MSKEKLFWGFMIINIICLSFLIGLIVHKFTLHSEPLVRPTISFQAMDVTEKTSPQEIVNQFYHWMQLDSQRSKTIFAEGMPIYEEESGTNILDLIVEPKELIYKLVDWTVGIQYGKPETYVSVSIPQLDLDRKDFQVLSTQSSSLQPVVSTPNSKEPKIIVGDSGKIYIGIPKEDMLHQKYKKESLHDQQTGQTQIATQDVTEQSDRLLEEVNSNNTDNIQIEKTKPRILIYHTHTTETYLDDTTPQDKQNHVFLPNKGKIVDAGAELAKTLESYGFQVYHDQTNYMKDGIVKAYTNSQKGVLGILGEGYFDVVLDLHRDGTGLPKGSNALPRNQYVTKINGKSAARVLLLISLGKESYYQTEEELDRIYPNRKDNYAFAAALASKMQEVYPGLLRRLEPTKNRLYNQQLHKHALLVEVGFELNTVAEAVYTGELLANVISELYKDQPASILINR